MCKIIKGYTQNRLSFHHSYQRTQTSERLPSLRYFSLSAIDLRSVKDWDAIKPDHIGKSNTGLKHTGSLIAVHKEGCNVWHCTPNCGCSRYFIMSWFHGHFSSEHLHANQKSSTSLFFFSKLQLNMLFCGSFLHSSAIMISTRSQHFDPLPTYWLSKLQKDTELYLLNTGIM